CASSPADGTEAAVWTSPREAPKCAPREVFRAPSRPQEACGGPLLTLPAAAQPRHAECATTPYLLLQFCKTLPTCDAGGAIGTARCFIPSELLCHPCQRACGGPRSQLLTESRPPP